MYHFHNRLRQCYQGRLGRQTLRRYAEWLEAHFSQISRGLFSPMYIITCTDNSLRSIPNVPSPLEPAMVVTLSSKSYIQTHKDDTCLISLLSWIQGHPEFGFGFKALVCHDSVCITFHITQYAITKYPLCTGFRHEVRRICDRWTVLR